MKCDSLVSMWLELFLALLGLALFLLTRRRSATSGGASQRTADAPESTPELTPSHGIRCILQPTQLSSVSLATTGFHERLEDTGTRAMPPAVVLSDFHPDLGSDGERDLLVTAPALGEVDLEMTEHNTESKNAHVFAVCAVPTAQGSSPVLNALEDDLPGFIVEEVNTEPLKTYSASASEQNLASIVLDPSKTCKEAKDNNQASSSRAVNVEHKNDDLSKSVFSESAFSSEQSSITGKSGSEERQKLSPALDLVSKLDSHIHPISYHLHSPGNFKPNPFIINENIVRPERPVSEAPVQLLTSGNVAAKRKALENIFPAIAAKSMLHLAGKQFNSPLYAPLSTDITVCFYRFLLNSIQKSTSFK